MILRELVSLFSFKDLLRNERVRAVLAIMFWKALKGLFQGNPFAKLQRIEPLQAT